MPLGMHNNQHVWFCHADQNIPIFAIICAIIQKFDCKGITKNIASIVKPNTVFAQIARGFGIIPFKFFIYRIIRDTRGLSS